MSNEAIGLAAAVQAVRAELIEAAAAGHGSDVLFELGDIDMEFTVELRREVSGGAKVRAWVVEAGAQGVREDTSTHKVAFTLKAINGRTGRSWLVGSEQEGGTDLFGQGEDR